MIDKQNFYHGAAIISILEHPKCEEIRASNFGYLINSEINIVLKYTTKNRSPWRFSFSASDLEKINSFGTEKVFIAMVCGGDGICPISIDELNNLVTGANGWVSAKRKFHEQYLVTGSNGVLTNKVSLRRWPEVIFGP